MKASTTMTYDHGSETVRIESMSHDGRGVSHIDGKAVFIEDALPDEEVLLEYRHRHRKYDEARITSLVRQSPDRVTPQCAFYGICGGCSLQHMDPVAQLRAKQQVLLDNLLHIGRVAPREVMSPLTGPLWGYRRKARIGVKYVEKKRDVLVGFRERRSSFIADIDECKVLHPSVGLRLMPLRNLIAGLKAYRKIPQIEIAVGDEATGLVFRHLVPLVDADLDALRAFGERHQLQIYLQSAGPDSVTLLWPQTGSLSYNLPAYDIRLFFQPTAFVQINAEINLRMIERALMLLDLQTGDRVLDLFCGLGNFSLPVARKAASVVGIEGDAGLIQQACSNARYNQIENVRFITADLTRPLTDAIIDQGFEKILLDPPRTGAKEVLSYIAAAGASRIVYVSCNPSTLARDAGELVHRYGYALTQAGVMDMFPHTSHIESIALFEHGTI